MSRENPAMEPTQPYEYLLLEGDSDDPKPVFLVPNQTSPLIDPSLLKLHHRIGRGPFGDVWVATHHYHSEDYDHYQEVAVKMLHPVKDDQVQILLARFSETFATVQGLANVCFLHGMSIQNGRVCVVMKFCEGSIGDKMSRLKSGKLSLFDVLRYGCDLGQGLLGLHSRGILALNLKPCNFLLDEQDNAVVGDIGIPFLLLGIHPASSDLIQRAGTPNYMAPEQWQPNVRGPISVETDSWGFACSVVEMLTGVQPWRGKCSEEIYELVVMKKGKPKIPDGLPSEIVDVLSGCFEHDFRNRPAIEDVLRVFKRCMQNEDYVVGDRDDPESQKVERLLLLPKRMTNWSLLKDTDLRIGDVVRSRKQPRSSRRAGDMGISGGTIVGIEVKDGGGDHILVRVQGHRDPVQVQPSQVEKVIHGFAAGDTVRLMGEDGKRSQVGILHGIARDGTVNVGFIGLDILWKGNYAELQMAEAYYAGQFVKLKSSLSEPRFEWPVKKDGEWSTGRIAEVLPNGCLVVKFPGKFSLGEVHSALADPAEVQAISFDRCDSLVKKYQHLEDFHWAVRPLVIAISIFTALKLGLFVRKSARSSTKNAANGSENGTEQQLLVVDSSVGSKSWLPPSVASILFREEGAPSAP